MGLKDPENLRLEALLGFALVFFTSFTVIDKMPSTATYSGLVGVLGAISWIAMPYLIYRDIEELPEISWSPNKYLYAFTAFMPYVNIGLTLFYVVNRHKINDSLKKKSRNFFRPDWWKFALASAAVFIIGATVFSSASDVSSELTLLGDIGMLMASIGWIGVPLALSFDRAFLKQAYGIEFGSLLTKASLIPFVSVAAAVIYLVERQTKISGHKKRRKKRRRR